MKHYEPNEIFAALEKPDPQGLERMANESELGADLALVHIQLMREANEAVSLQLEALERRIIEKRSRSRL